MSRRRAVNACSACHRRRIRCDVDLTKTPCSKCTELGEVCTLRTRKPYRSRALNTGRPGCVSGDDCHKSTTASSSIAYFNHAKLVAATITRPSSRVAPIFAGEGGYGDILDTAGDTEHQHFFIPAEAERSLVFADLGYLKLNGCFSFPTESDELVRAYFQFVHPSFPILDAPTFLRDYSSGGVNRINVLLMWSMFSIAASYVPTYAKKDVKESFVHRAKLLFDLTRENDKIILTQSALLLSFWFADAEDIKQSWYWTSVAFGIAQTLGLHRDLKVESSSPLLRQRSLWRNIWRCCMIRDVWLAFGMGRPLRLNKADSTALYHRPQPTSSRTSYCRERSCSQPRRQFLC